MDKQSSKLQMRIVKKLQIEDVSSQDSLLNLCNGFTPKAIIG